MKGMIESTQVQHINAQCHPLLVYLHKLSGIHYSATYESARTYELIPIHGASKQVTIRDLADAEVWQKLS